MIRTLPETISIFETAAAQRAATQRILILRESLEI